MTLIIRNRTIRPSSRKATSTSYKVDTSKVSAADKLEVNINHESKSFNKKYLFDGRDIGKRKSIHFKVYDHGDRIEIIWSGVSPKSKSSVLKIMVQPK